MLLEVREVSRKTPGDGRLEITEVSARRLAMHGTQLPVAVDEARGEGRLVAMRCTCDKGGASGGHQHHFVESPLFRQLPAGETVVLELLDGPQLSVARPHSLRPV
ncbi:MAG: hypothetical protein IPF98_13000 [Gemmatimonadetes bacterium]|nr:hypothetical protein [Gemmatimonadota bacterium]MCC6774200.1 hypothetical protein [Gemmatimonadaceae bacterium]